MSAVSSFNLGQAKCEISGVKTNPIVIFSILDHYSRRSENQDRVIGTLLGRSDASGMVEVTGCFPVPHDESDEQVAVDMEFHKMMSDLHSQVGTDEKIVGWYSTCEEIKYNSVLIHEFYQKETFMPVHITLDPSLRGFRKAKAEITSLDAVQIPTAAFISTPIGLGDKVLGCQFHQVPLEVDRSSLSVLKPQGLSVGPVPIESDFVRLENALIQLDELLADVLTYIDKAISGETQPNEAVVGRELRAALASLPHIDVPQLERLVQGSVQDMLMVVYLTNLTRTHLALAEQLETIL